MPFPLSSESEYNVMHKGTVTTEHLCVSSYKMAAAAAAFTPWLPAEPSPASWAWSSTARHSWPQVVELKFTGTKQLAVQDPCCTRRLTHVCSTWTSHISQCLSHSLLKQCSLRRGINRCCHPLTSLARSCHQRSLVWESLTGVFGWQVARSGSHQVRFLNSLNSQNYGKIFCVNPSPYLPALI